MARKRDAPFTSFVVASCSLIFLVTLYASEAWFYGLILRYGVVPSLLLSGYNPLSLLTYMFFHAGFQHLLTNMFVLLSVGRAIEKEIGTAKFSAIYLGSGVLAGLAHAVLNPGSSIPVIGASGAIFGLIAVLLLLMPFEITTAMIIPLPGVAVGVVLLVIEVFSLLMDPGSEVAHDIHLYGFFFGGIAAFAVDYDRALRGLVIAAVTLLALYVWAVYFNGFTF
jgi:membrane associated rhomboid family serine protease